MRCEVKALLKAKAKGKETPLLRISWGALAVWLLLGCGLAPIPLAAKPTVPSQMAVGIVPHRAVYDMTLLRADQGSGIADVRGRMVFEFSGSPCEGYTLNMRMITHVTDKKGQSSLTDLRSSTWEAGDGARFRFQTIQFQDDKLLEETVGDAWRKPSQREDEKGGDPQNKSTGEKARSVIHVVLRRPTPAELEIPGHVLFPTQHSLALLRAALAGKRVLQADIYDGSEKGQKVFATTAFIGAQLPTTKPAENKPTREKAESRTKTDQPEEGMEKNPLADDIETALAGVVSWPVTVSFFDGGGSEAKALPLYELGFRMYANGVSRKLRIDYGDFAIRGRLTQLKLFSPTPCE